MYDLADGTVEGLRFAIECGVHADSDFVNAAANQGRLDMVNELWEITDGAIEKLSVVLAGCRGGHLDVEKAYWPTPGEPQRYSPTEYIQKKKHILKFDNKYKKMIKESAISFSIS